jgi:Arc/MetJ-type ribon-helix-helix transcriptional regulator
MKVSVSLSEEDVAFLDAETRQGVFASRSAAVAAAIRACRSRDLAAAYFEAFRDWNEAEENEAWDAVLGDGIE